MGAGIREGDGGAHLKHGIAGDIRRCANCGKDISGGHWNRKFCDIYCRGVAYGQINKEKAKQWRENNPERAASADLRNHLRNKFGLTLEDYEAMLVVQDRRCKICLRTAGEADRCFKRLGVDHCHSTGKIRGLLCRSCNAAIGQLQDSPRIIKRAAAYLEGQL
ncbi:endonuclease VII domain-containing protein [Streptomyces sp. 21So2-11]|uniref:endonuclease VII domain-containing protein n=1 Tax=Streptomyces sp. 21So2-11 TaxID=3144408 RepID=UPI00321A63CC